MKKSRLILMLAFLALVFCAQAAHAKNVRFTIVGSLTTTECSKPDARCYYSDTKGTSYSCSFDTPKCEEIFLQCSDARCEVEALVQPYGGDYEITRITAINVVKKL